MIGYNINQKGNLLLETLVSLAIIALLVSSLAAFPYTLLRSVVDLSERNNAMMIAENELEAARGMQYSNWESLRSVTSDSYHIVKGANGWELSAGAGTDGKFQYELFFNDVNRDNDGNVSLNGGVVDPGTIEAESRVTWNTSIGERSVSLKTYLSSWTYDFSYEHNAPSAFNLLSPTDGTEVETRTPSFDWEDARSSTGPVTYTLIIDNTPNFANPEIVVSGLTNSHYTLAGGTEQLSWIIRYYWKVIATDGTTNTESNQINWNLRAVWW